MSWIDKIQNNLIITTADNKQYKPSWLNAVKTVEYHTAVFEFPNLAGSKVDRRKPIGRKYDLEIYFQGEDHLDQAAEFETSANDNSKPWILEHPFYDRLTVEPTALKFDNSTLNITKITGVLLETITDDNPRTAIQPIDAIRISKINIDETFEQSLTTTPTAADVTSLKETNKKNYKLSVPIIKIPDEFEKLNYAFEQANSFVTTATASPLLAIRYTMRLTSLPGTFNASVKSRISVLGEQYNALRLKIAQITTPSAKQLFQSTGGTILSTMCLAASLPIEGDYLYANNVIDIMDSIVERYGQLLEDVDSLQTDNGGSPNSYIPDASAFTALSSLVNLTVANLFSIALGAKKERVIFTESDTNLILLTHRFYSLDPDDNNIEELMENNNFSLEQILQIKKGTKVVYYI